jgi:hypothetical protein
MLVMFGDAIESLSGEAKENKVRQMLRSKGMKGVTEVMATAGVYFATVFLAMFLFIPYAKWLALPAVGLEVLLAFYTLFVVQNWLQTTLLSYLIGREYAFLVQGILFGTQFLLGLMLSATETPVAAVVQYNMSILPFTGFMNFANAGVNAMNLGMYLNFYTMFTTEVSGVFVGNIFVVMLCTTSITGLCLAYIWPLKIGYDWENPLPLSYPFTCACLRRKTTTDEE